MSNDSERMLDRIEKIREHLKMADASEYPSLVDELTEMASTGFAGANDMLGYVYDEGRLGVQIDKARAFEHYMKAAQYGLPDSQYAVGAMLYYGEGVAENEEEGRDWIIRAAKGGCSAALDAMSVFELNEGSAARSLSYHVKARAVEFVAENSNAPSLISTIGHELNVDAVTDLVWQRHADRYVSNWVAEQIQKWEESLPQNVRERLLVEAKGRES